MSSAIDLASAWRDLFQNWPKGITQNGVLITAFDEQIPYEAFMASDAMLIVSRKTPDTVGARKVIVAYEHVRGVKIVDVIDGKPFEEVGFKGTLPRK